MWKLRRSHGKAGKDDAEQRRGSSTSSWSRWRAGSREIVAEHDLSELIVDTKDTTLTVRRGGAMRPQPDADADADADARAGRARSAAAGGTPPRRRPPRRSTTRSHVVTSPFVGTFYRKPNPDSPNYVVDRRQDRQGPGALHRRGDEADERDRGRRRRHDHRRSSSRTAQPVEYGQPLFKIARRSSRCSRRSWSPIAARSRCA